MESPTERAIYTCLLYTSPKDSASFVITSTLGDPTAKCAMAKTYYSNLALRMS